MNNGRLNTLDSPEILSVKRKAYEIPSGISKNKNHHQVKNEFRSHNPQLNENMNRHHHHHHQRNFNATSPNSHDIKHTLNENQETNKNHIKTKKQKKVQFKNLDNNNKIILKQEDKTNLAIVLYNKFNCLSNDELSEENEIDNIVTEENNIKLTANIQNSDKTEIQQRFGKKTTNPKLIKNRHIVFHKKCKEEEVKKSSNGLINAKNYSVLEEEKVKESTILPYFCSGGGENALPSCVEECRRLQGAIINNEEEEGDFLNNFVIVQHESAICKNSSANVDIYLGEKPRLRSVDVRDGVLNKNSNNKLIISRNYISDIEFASDSMSQGDYDVCCSSVCKNYAIVNNYANFAPVRDSYHSDNFKCSNNDSSVNKNNNKCNYNVSGLGNYVNFSINFNIFYEIDDSRESNDDNDENTITITEINSDDEDNNTPRRSEDTFNTDSSFWKRRKKRLKVFWDRILEKIHNLRPSITSCIFNKILKCNFRSKLIKFLIIFKKILIKNDFPYFKTFLKKFSLFLNVILRKLRSFKRRNNFNNLFNILSLKFKKLKQFFKFYFRKISERDFKMNKKVIKKYGIIFRDDVLPELLQENNTDLNASENIDHPYIKITVFDAEILALLDTGAQTSLISQDLYDKLRATNKIATLPVTNSFLQGIGNTRRLRVNLQCFLIINISDKIFEYSFIIARGLEPQLILGYDFLTHFKTDINMNTFTFSISNIEDNRAIGVPIVNKDNLNSKTFNISFYDHFYEETHRKYAYQEIEDTYDKFRGFQESQSSKEITKQHMESLLDRINHDDSFSDEDKDLMKRTLLDNYDVFSEEPGLVTNYQCKLVVKPHAVYQSKSYPIPFSKREAAEKEIARMLSLDVIEPSFSHYSSPIVCIEKKDGGVRLCLDSRNLNKILINDQESPPNIVDLLQRFHGTSMYSTLDLAAGYWQIEVEESSRDYLSFVFNGKNYRFKRLAFGIQHAMATFQKAMNEVLGDILETCILYVDDAILAGSNVKELCSKMNLFFKRLIERGVKIKLSKCELFSKHVKFLGHIISAEGVTQDPEKLAAIKDIPPPTSRRQLQRFIGNLQFYRRFNKHMSSYTTRLSHVLSTNKPWKWGPEEQSIFDELKEQFLKSVVLHHPDFAKPFYINADASHHALGAEIYQLDNNGDKQVIAFFSKSLTDCQKRYTTTEKELFSIVQVCLKYRTLLLGRRIICHTDHVALTFFKTAKLTNNRLSRWYLALQEFNLELLHIPGKSNNSADFLSRDCDTSYNPSTIFKCYPVRLPKTTPIYKNVRPLIINTNNFLTLAKLIEHQLRDPHCLNVINLLNDRAIVNKPDFLQQFKIFKNVLFYQPSRRFNVWKIYIPESLIDLIISECHERYSHFGVNKIFAILNDVIYFKNLRKHVQKIVSSCDVCQRIKHNRFDPSGPLKSIIPRQKLETLSADIFGPIPRSRYRHKYIFVVIDLFSKYIQLYPLRKITSEKLIEFILDKWVPTIGSPQRILSDNASYFTSSYWTDSLLAENIEPICTTTYRPQGNPVERSMRVLSTIFRAYCHQKHTSWYQYVEYVEHCINNTMSDSTKLTPHQIMFGTRSKTFLEKIIPFPVDLTANSIDYTLIARRNLLKAAEKRKRYFDKKIKPVTYRVGDKILKKTHYLSDTSKLETRKFFHIFEGPYRLVSIRNNNTVKIVDLDGDNEQTVNVANIKPYKEPI